jgi:hypothetical protein
MSVSILSNNTNNLVFGKQLNNDDTTTYIKLTPILKQPQHEFASSNLITKHKLTKKSKQSNAQVSVGGTQIIPLNNPSTNKTSSNKKTKSKKSKKNKQKLSNDASTATNTLNEVQQQQQQQHQQQTVAFINPLSDNFKDTLNLINIESNQSIRWFNDRNETKEEEEERLKIYKMNRRKRYIEAKNKILNVNSNRSTTDSAISSLSSTNSVQS